MKVGILTEINSCNYGGILQGFALATVLRKMGLDATQIDFWFSKKNKALWGDLAKAKSKLGFIFWFILSVFKYKSFRAAKVSLMRSRASVAFLKDFMPLSSRTYKNRAALATLSADGYSHIIVGSDQVWNPKEFPTPNPFLLANVTGVQKLSYAASVGIAQLPVTRVNEYRDALRSFQAISLREHANVSEFQSLAKCPVVAVLDPSLLLTDDEWYKALHLMPKKRSEEVVIYWLGDLSSLKHVVDQLKATGQTCRVFSVPKLLRKRVKNYRSAYQFFKKENVSLCLEADPCEFVSAIASAKAVISDSFHAMMFSAIFQTPCKIVIGSKAGRQDMGVRMTDFLSHYVSNNPVVQVVDEIGSVDALESVKFKASFEDAKAASIAWIRHFMGNE